MDLVTLTGSEIDKILKFKKEEKIAPDISTFYKFASDTTYAKTFTALLKELIKQPRIHWPTDKQSAIRSIPTTGVKLTQHTFGKMSNDTETSSDNSLSESGQRPSRLGGKKNVTVQSNETDSSGEDDDESSASLSSNEAKDAQRRTGVLAKKDESDSEYESDTPISGQRQSRLIVNATNSNTNGDLFSGQTMANGNNSETDDQVVDKTQLEKNMDKNGPLMSLEEKNLIDKAKPKFRSEWSETTKDLKKKNDGLISYGNGANKGLDEIVTNLEKFLSSEVDVNSRNRMIKYVTNYSGVKFSKVFLIGNKKYFEDNPPTAFEAWKKNYSRGTFDEYLDQLRK